MKTQALHEHLRKERDRERDKTTSCQEIYTPITHSIIFRAELSKEDCWREHDLGGLDGIGFWSEDSGSRNLVGRVFWILPGQRLNL